MTTRRKLKLIHLLSTLWFAAAAAFLLVVALRQAGVQWWVIFSLSGHSLLIASILVSIYLVTIFRGAQRTSHEPAEHPLTCAISYRLFYYVAPFLGALAGLLGGPHPDLHQKLMTIAYGTLGTTFLIWIVIDPGICACEMLIPSSRRFRRIRQEQERLAHEAHCREQQELIEKLRGEEKLQRQKCACLLQPLVRQIIMLLRPPDQAPADAALLVDIGLAAWRIGGQPAMAQLHQAARAELAKSPENPPADLISRAWDGIGSWRHTPSFRHAVPN